MLAHRFVPCNVFDWKVKYTDRINKSYRTDCITALLNSNNSKTRSYSSIKSKIKYLDTLHRSHTCYSQERKLEIVHQLISDIDEVDYAMGKSEK